MFSMYVLKETQFEPPPPPTPLQEGGGGLSSSNLVRMVGIKYFFRGGDCLERVDSFLWHKSFIKKAKVFTMLSSLFEFPKLI